MANRTKLALLASPVLISACVQDVNPEWETYFSTSDNKNNIEWLNHVVADNNDDLILAGSVVITGVNRNQNSLLAKFDQNGNKIWDRTFDFKSNPQASKSDDSVVDVVTDNNGNIYALGQTIETVNGDAEFSSFIIKTNQDGDLIWQQSISAAQDSFDIELKDNALFVTGLTTQKLSLDGEVLLSIDHSDRNWDVEIDDLGNIYIAGRTGVSKYSSTGELVWSQPTTDSNLSYRVNIELDEYNNAILLAQSDLNTNTQYIRSYSLFGESNWSKSVSIGDSNELVGHPAIVVSNNQYWFALSDSSERTVLSLTVNGAQNWRFEDAQGPIQAMGRLANGNIAITGAGKSALLGSRGDVVATNTAQYSGSTTSGSLVVDGNQMFVGTSVSTPNGIDIHLAKFEQ